jgi:hypothetical protein
MRTLGIAIDPGAGKPRLFGVIASGSVQSPVLEDEFDIKVGGSEANEQAVDLACYLQGKLPGLDFDEAAIRVASAGRPQSNRLRGHSFRAHAEGAALFVLREHLHRPILLGDPKSFAKLTGEKKDDLEARAAELSKGKSDAAIAAIAALSLG